MSQLAQGMKYMIDGLEFRRSVVMNRDKVDEFGYVI